MVFCFTSAGCQRKECPLSETSNSPKGIATRLLAALESKDERALWSLMVTESEFKEIIWTPYEKMGMGDPDQPWFINWMDAKKAIGRALHDYGGRKLKLVGVSFGKGKKDIGPFKIWRDCRILVKDEHGEEKELRYINTVVEMNDRYKVVAYHS